MLLPNNIIKENNQPTKTSNGLKTRIMEDLGLNDIRQFAASHDENLELVARMIARLYMERGREKELPYILKEEGIPIPKPIQLSDICNFTLTATKTNGELIKIGELRNIIEGEERLEIHFTKTEIRALNQKPFNKTSPLILLENIILQGKVHWLWGFVFLDDWVSGKAGKEIGNPRWQFGNYISKKINKFKKYGFDIEHLRGSDEWRLNYETTTSRVECNLLEARNNYKDALTEFEGGNLNKAIEKLKLAISPPCYPDIMFVDAYNLLIRCVFKTNYENIPESLLSKIKDFLSWYTMKLETAIFFIRKVYLQKGILSEAEIGQELNKIEAEFKETQKNYEALKNRITISEQDNDSDEIVRIIHDLREVLNDEVIINERLPEVTFETEEFIAVKNNKYVKEIFKLNLGDLKRLKPYLYDKEETEDFLLFQIINRGINFSKHRNLVSIKKFLHQRLKEEIKHLADKATR